MRVLEKIRQRAKQKSKRIVLPEAEDIRVLKAASEASSLNLAKIILVGEVKKIEDIASSNSIKLDGIEIVGPLKSKNLQNVIDRFFQLRKHKGITESKAKDIVTGSTLYYAALMVREGQADGFVAGAVETSANVARAAIQCVGVDKTVGILSSAFVMGLEGCPYGEEGAFIFADCGIVPNPSPRQLAGIAFSSATLFKFLFEKEPIVAMLSYSTKGSAKGPLVEKVVEATRLANKLYPSLIIDGELQLDSALDKEVAQRKCPNSPVGGKANVLIFPDLNSGNIAYKLAERLVSARAVGPLLQGLTKPCSDISRSSKYKDIVDAIAITVVMDK